MEPAADLVVDAAPAHVLKRSGDNGQQPLLAGLDVNIQKQIERAGVGEFGGRAEPAVLRVEHAADVLHQRLHHFFVSAIRASLELLHLAKRFRNLRGAFMNLLTLRLVIVRDGFQQALHARAAGAVLGRKISSPVEGPAVRSKKCRQRPSALASQGAHRRLIARVDIRAFVAIDLYGNERRIDDPRHFSVFVALAVHHVAPVAPDGADVEQDGLVLFARLAKGGI